MNQQYVLLMKQNARYEHAFKSEMENIFKIFEKENFIPYTRIALRNNQKGLLLYLQQIYQAYHKTPYLPWDPTYFQNNLPRVNSDSSDTIYILDSLFSPSDKNFNDFYKPLLELLVEGVKSYSVQNDIRVYHFNDDGQFLIDILPMWYKNVPESDRNLFRQYARKVIESDPNPDNLDYKIGLASSIGDVDYVREIYNNAPRDEKESLKASALRDGTPEIKKWFNSLIGANLLRYKGLPYETIQEIKKQMGGRKRSKKSSKRKQKTRSKRKSRH